MVEEEKPKKKMNCKEGFAWGMSIGQDIVRRRWANKTDYSKPKWRRMLEKVPPIVWLGLAVVIIYYIYWKFF